MRAIIKILLSLFIGLIVPFPTMATNDVEVTDIIIVLDPSDGQVVHRGPAPISGCYWEDAIRVCFLEFLGCVVVEVENQTTGEYNQSNVNALVGPMTFPISGTSGHWTIRFTLSDGTVYYGNFDI